MNTRLLVLLLLSTLAALLPAETPARSPLLDKQTALVFYGWWSESDISRIQQYDIAAFQQGHYLGSDEAAAIGEIRASGTLVFLYISIGEDSATFSGQPPRTGNGRGPCFYDPDTQKTIYQNRGIASYYLDHWNTKGFLSGDIANRYSDGLPDRHGDWGACYVNAGDPEWQEIIIDEIRRLTELSIDGLFLDTPETPDPWQGYGWTAEGMHSLIANIRRTFPEQYLLLNRGVFFFDPNNPHQYAWNPIDLVDIALFESYFLDSSYSDTIPERYEFHISPFYLLNKYYSSPKMNVAVSSHDRQLPVIQVDYARFPEEFPEHYPELFDRYAGEAFAQGRIPFLADRNLDTLDSPFLDYRPPVDTEAPQWQNSSRGRKELYTDTYAYDIVGYDYLQPQDYVDYPSAPRIGIQKLLPTDEGLTVLWDVAVDQTRPVRYNIYYSDSLPFSFSEAEVLIDVPYVLSDDYLVRGYLSSDNACPYEFTIMGLQRGKAYYVAVRAEDSTEADGLPVHTSIGPSRGIEDRNEELLAAVLPEHDIRNSKARIVIDGRFEDWVGVPGIRSHDADCTAGIRSISCWDDEANLYAAIELQESVAAGELEVYINADSLSFTGDPSLFGADYSFAQGRLHHYDGQWLPAADQTGIAWASAEAAESAPDTTADSAAGRDRIEIQIPKAHLKNLHPDHIFIICRNSSSGVPYPQSGSSGIAWALRSTLEDRIPPKFAAGQFTVDTASLSDTVIIGWPPAYDDSSTVTYRIVRSDTGETFRNLNGKLLQGIASLQTRVTGLPAGIPTPLSVIAEDRAGNRTASTPIVAIPTSFTLAPVWIPGKADPALVRNDAGIALHFNPALCGRHPADYEIRATENNSQDEELIYRRVRFRQSNIEGYDYLFPMNDLKPFTEYRLALTPIGPDGKAYPEKAKRLEVEIPGFKRVSLESMDGFFEDWNSDKHIVRLDTRSLASLLQRKKLPSVTRIKYVFREGHLFVNIAAQFDSEAEEDFSIRFDTDNNPDTGFQGSIGADYVLYSDGTLFRLADGEVWEAELVGTIVVKRGLGTDKGYEFALPESLVGSFPDTMTAAILIHCTEGCPEHVTERQVSLNTWNRPDRSGLIGGIVFGAIVLLLVPLTIFAVPGISFLGELHKPDHGPRHASLPDRTPPKTRRDSHPLPGRPPKRRL